MYTRILQRFFPALLLLSFFNAGAQSTNFTVKQQTADFALFQNGLREGHGGLFYFIDEKTFNRQCDSIRQTFSEHSSVGSYYLKLRYLLSLLGHGHSSLDLPFEKSTSYKMAVLQKEQLYLPLQLRIIDEKLYAMSDCSAEQAIPQGMEIVRINGISTKKLLAAMLPYLFADGKNQTFKYYFLYNYYYFHFLYQLLYPKATRFDIVLSNGNKVSVKGRRAAEIEETYVQRNKRSISNFDDPLRYEAELSKGVAYLKVGSFFKGFIENFGKQYEPFIDSVFNDLHRRQTPHLILDLRDNEGGGDHYNDILFSHISAKPFVTFGFDQVAGKKFSLVQYTTGLSDEVKAYIKDPGAFLRDDSSLFLKQEYTDGKTVMEPSADAYQGRIYVLTNGGTFSAANILVRYLYSYRKESGRPILFVGEENGGDIYSNVQCAGQGYSILLPNSSIKVNMPFLCEGVLNKIYPKESLPDYKVSETLSDTTGGNDAVVQFVIRRLVAQNAKAEGNISLQQ